MARRSKQGSLGYVRGYGRGSAHGYASKSNLRMSSRRRPSYLPALLAFISFVLLLVLLVGGTAWYNYSRFTKAVHAQDSQRVQSLYAAGIKAPVPGSSTLFFWMTTKFATADLSRAANEGIETGAVQAFVDTYRETPEIISEIVIPKAVSAVEQYKEKILEEHVAHAYLEIGLSLRPENPDLLQSKETFDILSASRAAFAAAKKAAEQPYGSEEAADLFELVAEIDAENYAIAQAEIPELRKKANEEMTTWTQPVKHFTLNPLLAFPQNTPLDYANDYITVAEFKNVLAQLFDNDYILVGLETLYSVNASDTVIPATVRIPKDKKPFVLSIENLSYAPRHAGRGMVDKLIVKDDRIATWTAAGHADSEKDVISFDNDVIPILDTFIEENPTFSWRGARATIALAGYSGNFGYRTAYGAEDQAEQVEQAKAVAKVLQENGYTFASLGFEYLAMAEVEPTQIATDAQLWVDQTSNIVGTTPLFFWPFGTALPQDSEGAEVLRSFGYRSFSQTGPNNFEDFTGSARTDERAFIDGGGFNYWPHRYDGYFDVEAVLDTEGRGLMSYWLEWY